jgi:hypothetical protein
MTDRRNGPWHGCLPGCAAEVPCGQGRHEVRWEGGALVLPEHPDAEGELVLAALGGEKAGCLEVAEAWERHTADLSVLAIGPRGPADQIDVSWADVTAAVQAGPPVVPFGPGGPPGAGRPGLMRPPSQVRPPGLMRPPGQVRSTHMRAARWYRTQDDLERSRLRRTDMLSLLALGYGFQVRLIGQVAAAYADRPDGRAEGEARVRPALVAAVAGRLAPAAESWLGIDPEQVVVSLYDGPGWGSAELAGRGAERRLQVSLPAGWLASVWACGLALVGRHLVVAVEEPGWPDARVLGLRAPGAEPEPLDVHGTLGAPGGPPDAPHWEI